MGEARFDQADRPVAVTPGELTQVGVAWFLAEDLGRVVYIRDVHVSADDGSCRGCCTQMAVTVWPCILRRLADDVLARLIPTQRGPAE